MASIYDMNYRERRRPLRAYAKPVTDTMGLYRNLKSIGGPFAAAAPAAASGIGLTSAAIPSAAMGAGIGLSSAAIPAAATGAGVGLTAAAVPSVVGTAGAAGAGLGAAAPAAAGMGPLGWAALGIGALASLSGLFGKEEKPEMREMLQARPTRNIVPRLEEAGRRRRYGMTDYLSKFI